MLEVAWILEEKKTLEFPNVFKTDANFNFKLFFDFKDDSYLKNIVVKLHIWLLHTTLLHSCSVSQILLFICTFRHSMMQTPTNAYKQRSINTQWIKYLLLNILR